MQRVPSILQDQIAAGCRSYSRPGCLPKGFHSRRRGFVLEARRSRAALLFYAAAVCARLIDIVDVIVIIVVSRYRTECRHRL